MHAEQLKVILAASGAHSSEMDEWGAEFAKLHDLDYDSIRKNARGRRAIVKASLIARKAALAMNTYFVRAPDDSMSNVFEASIAAAGIRANAPGLTRRFLRLSKQALQLSLEKGSASNKR